MPVVQRTSPSRPTTPDISHATHVNSDQSSPSGIALHVPTTKTTAIGSAAASQPLSLSRTASIQRQFGTAAGQSTITTSYKDTKPPSLYSKQPDIHYHNNIDMAPTKAQRTTRQSLSMLSASPSNCFHGSSSTQYSLTTPSNTLGSPDASSATSKSSNPQILLGGSVGVPLIPLNSRPTQSVNPSGPGTTIAAVFSSFNSSVLPVAAGLNVKSPNTLGNLLGTKQPSKSQEGTEHTHTQGSRPVSQPSSTSASLPNAGNPIITKTTSNFHTSSSSAKINFTTSGIPASAGRPVSTSARRSTPILTTSTPQGRGLSNSFHSSAHTSINAGTTTHTTPTRSVSTSARSMSILTTSPPQGHNVGNSIHSSARTTSNAGTTNHTTPTTSRPVSISATKSAPILTTSPLQGHNLGNSIHSSAHTAINAGTTTHTTPTRLVSTSVRSTSILTISTPQDHNMANPIRFSSPTTHATSTRPVLVSAGSTTILVIPASQRPSPTETQETTPSTNASTRLMRVENQASISQPPAISTLTTPTPTPTPPTPTMSANTADPVAATFPMSSSNQTEHSTSTTTITNSVITSNSSKNSMPSGSFNSASSPSETGHKKWPEKSGNNDSHGGMSTAEKDAIIGGSVAAAVSIITLILVLVALLICRRKKRRQRGSSQQQILDHSLINVPGRPGISYIPVFPVSAAPPYQQTFPPSNQKADFQTLEFSNAKTHPSFAPAYGDTNQSVDGNIFQNITPIENLKPTSYVDGQGRMYSSHRNQDSATSNDIEYTPEGRPSFGQVQEHMATQSMDQPQRIRSVTSDTSVHFGVAL